MTANLIETSLKMLEFVAMAPPQPGEPPAKSIASFLVMIFTFLAIFYLIGIRPQQKQQNELRKQLESMKPGDKVLTTGGILGVVAQVKEKVIVVKISDNTRVEMVRAGIQQVIKDGKDEPAKDEKKAS